MRFVSNILLIAISSLATSTALPKTKSELATFDDLTTLPAASELTPVPFYKGLNYNAFDVLQQGILGRNILGVTPQSGSQVAANSIFGNILKGAASITTKPGSDFALKYLYLGCVVNTVETAASLPVVCTISFTAFKKGSSTPSQTLDYQFSPTNKLRSKMVKVSFPAATFSNLEKVEISIVQATTTNTLTGLLIDDVAYSISA